MNKIGDFKILLLGTRGSAPMPFIENMIYGGNTQSTLVDIDDHIIIFDGGTGISSSSKYLSKYNHSKEINIFLSHYHLDHIIGLPFFSPLFDKEYKINIFAPKFDGMDCKEYLSKLFCPPFWPISINQMLANITFTNIKPTDIIDIGNVKISTLALNHPNGSIGFKASYENKNFCYILDHEHTEDFTKPLSDFVNNSDFMLCDAPYTEDDYVTKKGYGHSVINRIYTLAANANVKKLVISHHDIAKNDEDLSVLESEMQEKYPDYIFAKERLEFLL